MLFERNAAILNRNNSKVISVVPKAVFLIATHPGDVITHISAKIASEHGVPYSRVIGPGQTLDTARFRSLLGNHVGVDPQHVHAYVIGEHGDSEVLTWSNVDIEEYLLRDFIEFRNVEFNEKLKQEN